MYKLRIQSMEQAKIAKVYCIILGTLGRQGNTGIMKRISKLLDLKGYEYIIVCSSEINHELLSA